MEDIQKVLHVEFDNEDVEFLVNWKRLCQYKFGQGGIKQRTIALVKEDILNLGKI